MRTYTLGGIFVGTSWEAFPMTGDAVAEAVEAIGASVSALAVLARRGTDGPELTGARSGAGAGPNVLVRDQRDPLQDQVDPLQERADAVLDGLAEAARLEARAAALKVRLAAEYADISAAMAPPAESLRDREIRRMSLTAEVAGALTVSEGAAERLLVESAALSNTLPLALEALQTGTISWQHARVMCDETSGLDPVSAAALEAHFLDPDAPGAARGCPAGDLVPSRFRAKVRAWRERHHPDSIETRHAKSAADRRLEYVPDQNGMAWLSAYLPADQAAGIWNRATATARAMQGPTESRTLTQLRVDAASGWMLTAGLGVDGVASGSTPAGDVPSPAAQVLVTVPVFSLLGITEEPAMLDGYGPIPPSMARRLVADGGTSFLRVLTDPRDGAPLEIGRTSYRLTKPMRQWLRLRDAKCTFPNCNNHSLDNDADHILAWADGGGTGVANLGQPCPKHHRLKHSTAWRPVGATRDAPPGWISPSGRSYPAEYQDWEPPVWPESLLALHPGQDWPLPPDRPEEPDWQELADWPEPPPFPQSDQGWPLPPDWPEPPPLPQSDQGWPLPPDWPGPPPGREWPDEPEDSDNLNGPEALNDSAPLPVDPWPHWASITAA
jgi:hypothetical protein